MSTFAMLSTPRYAGYDPYHYYNLRQCIPQHTNT